MKTCKKLRAVFIDRDGVLNDMVYDSCHGIMDSPRRPEHVHVSRGAARFTGTLRKKGFFTVVVTNQPGVAKGTMTLQELGQVNEHLAALLKKDGGGWDALYYCPHHTKVTDTACAPFVRTCTCRKPKPGMLVRAAKEWRIGLRESWMVGDGIVDVQAGKAAGCKTILVTNIKIDLLEKFFHLKQDLPDFIVANLDEAMKIILSEGCSFRKRPRAITERQRRHETMQ